MFITEGTSRRSKMTKEILESKKGIGLRLLGGFFFSLLMISLLGCPVVIPPIVDYEHHHGYVVTVKVPVDADKVFQAALEEVQSNPAAAVVKIQERSRQIQARGVVSGKEGAAFIKVTQLDAKKSQLMVTGSIEEKNARKAARNLALQIVQNICDKLGVQYTVISE
jgi:hypothetical protein